MEVIIREILKDWKAAAGVTHLMQYSIRAGILTIYTDCPGRLIGKGGELAFKFKQELMSLPYGRVKEVELKETDGIC